MKIKKDFITNSSSVAFICDVCGREESGMDIGLYDVGMYSCENGHYFCDEHLVNPEDNEIEDRYEILSEFCPICRFEVIKDSEMLKYLIKKYNLNMTNILDELKNKFPSYVEFLKYSK